MSSTTISTNAFYVAANNILKYFHTWASVLGFLTNSFSKDVSWIIVVIRFRIDFHIRLMNWHVWG